ncbi:MAG: phasin family protein [Geminicoccales bacterium]
MDREQVTPITEPTAAAERDQAALYAAGFNSLLSAGHALIDGCHAVSMEALVFWQSCLKEGLPTGQRLVACASAEGALEIQLDYAKAALQAYLDQSAKIGDLVARSLVQMGEPARPATQAATARPA